MPKKSYPGGFRLTLATARRLAVQEFGPDTCHKLIDEVREKGR